MVEIPSLLHPCAHTVYHTDLREDIGVISMKKTGTDERQLCLYMDGITADNFGYCKSDLLRVTVVKLIYNTFARAGIPCMNAEELLEAVKNDEEVWKLYERGYTVGLNQCEQPKTTSRVMRFKPKNIVELCAFVAAIRPGAKSLVDDYVNRKIHTYDIPALDNLLRLNGATGNTGKSSFLFYDENVLQLGQAAGIDPAKSYALLKHIKKKHHDEVAAFEDEFIPGFKKYLIEKENSSADLAEKTAKDIWKVILNSASYLFNASHSLAVAYDSLYGAYLKAHYPYEFYIEMLKHYTEKGDQKKIASIIDEMKRYKGIKLKVGVLGEDNRDWYVDKENKTITQNLSAIKYISNQAAEELYEAGKNCNFDSFIDVLRYLQTSTTVKKNQRDVLIMLGYFKRYGSVNKLMKLAKEFDDSKNKITKTLSAKSVGIRMSALKEMENTIKNEESDIDTILDSENKYIGLCLSIDESAAPNVYFIKEIDDKYSIKLTLYSIKRGSQGVVKVRKEDYVKEKPEVGMKLYIDYGRNKPRYIYKDGVREKTDELEYWVDAWHLERKDNEQY